MYYESTKSEKLDEERQIFDWGCCDTFNDSIVDDLLNDEDDKKKFRDDNFVIVEKISEKLNHPIHFN